MLAFLHPKSKHKGIFNKITSIGFAVFKTSTYAALHTQLPRLMT